MVLKSYYGNMKSDRAAAVGGGRRRASEVEISRFITVGVSMELTYEA